MNVLREILDWTPSRPLWQRDALRRLVTRGVLDDTDVLELVRLCKLQYGLSDGAGPVPLSEAHLPPPSDRDRSVSLLSLSHHAGVNALAPDQVLHFGPEMTIVYGDNAAGKSGYTRILKRACHARNAEEILGNVVSGTTLPPPSATITFLVDGQTHSLAWRDDHPANSFLSRVSVFDHHCASVYVSDKTDVAFRPLGLDVFDKLSAACGRVRKILEQERKSLQSRNLQIPLIPRGTAVHRQLTNLTSLTDREEIVGLATMSDADISRVRHLRAKLKDLQTEDPERAAQAIDFRAQRVGILLADVNRIDDALSDTTIDTFFETRNKLENAHRALVESRASVVRAHPLANIGSDAWRQLWRAAEQYSTADAYPENAFPNTEPESRCVLCQQELSEEGASRLRRFHELVNSELQSEYDRASIEYLPNLREIQGAVLGDRAVDALQEVASDEPEMAKRIRSWLRVAEKRREWVKRVLDGGLQDAQDRPNWPATVLDIDIHMRNLADRARTLRQMDHGAQVKSVRAELRELEARLILSDYVGEVLDDIARKRRIAAYQECIADTHTNAITLKSSKVTQHVVTDQLTRAFQKEREALGFRHVEVEMAVAGGSRGALYHKLQLRRAPGVEVSRVASEGEARCLSIASFFAELSTATHRSAILFDDPVSSLDHVWRRQVSKRLAEESQSRQVVVFTHDIVFLLELRSAAELQGVEVRNQHLRRDHISAGLSSQQLPWIATKVSKRVGRLRDALQGAEKIYRQGNHGEYRREASWIYGRLREAWERGVEEVLLNETVQRYGAGIQTNRAMKLADISESDLKELGVGMTKCSAWLPGHDQAPAVNAPFPDPAELRADIDALDQWVKKIRRRR